MVSQKASSFTGDGVFTVDQVGSGGKVSTYVKQNISNTITETFFAVVATEEVVTIGVESVVAVGAWLVVVAGRENW